MYADTDIEIFRNRTEVCLEAGQRLAHFQRGSDRIARLIGILNRCPPKGHDGIADKFVHGATMGEDDRYLATEIIIQQGDDGFCAVLFRKGGKAADIGKQHGDLAAFALHVQRGLATGDQILHHPRIEEAAEDLLRTLALLLFAPIGGEGRQGIVKPGEQQW